MNSGVPAEGYTLVICEKPDAARRVSEALAEGGVSTLSIDGVPTFRFERGGENFVVCAALGHVYDVADPFAERTVYPVFDVEWFQHNLIDEEATRAAKMITAVKKLTKNAEKFVNACDYDVEGETIGFNVLRYGCGGKEGNAFRAKFSTLTKDNLVQAFEKAQRSSGSTLASAGRARHVIDFVWGVNLSRALSQSAMIPGHRYRTVSVGRVQGPTLGFVVDREIGIRTFVSRPYWVVRGVFDKDGRKLVADYFRDRVYRKAEAEEVRKDCFGKEGRVDEIARSISDYPPPAPFNIGDLQKEAYRHFALSPSRTLQIAERLYLDALISYPRTSSQRLPPSIDYKRILRGLSGLREYAVDAGGLLKTPLKPIQGEKDDPAHPAIYPTGERQRRAFDTSEARLYDLIVRRFLAVFAPAARRETVTVTLSVDGHRFGLGGRKTLSEGWLHYYGKYASMGDSEIPALNEGDRLEVEAIEYDEKFESRPPRYNQGSLLEKMEKEKLGTKATRAEIISTLLARGYVMGESLTASDLGFAVIEVMERHAPSIVSTELTRIVEEGLERIENGTEGEKDLVREMIKAISDQLVVLNTNEASVGRDLDSAVLATAVEQNVIGVCPVCKTGKLRMIRSRKTHKRFVGCTNYAQGCRASAPLPQRGIIRTTNKACRHCSWPVVYVRIGRYPWRLCVNVNCPSKEGRKRELQTV